MLYIKEEELTTDKINSLIRKFDISYSFFGDFVVLDDFYIKYKCVCKTLNLTFFVDMEIGEVNMFDGAKKDRFIKNYCLKQMFIMLNEIYSRLLKNETGRIL